MVSRIVVENFKCFKEETVFDYRKTNYKLLEQNTVGKLLKGILFVGDNASGKTTAIQPIRLLLQLLFKDIDVKLFLYTCLFSGEKNTRLEYEFIIEGHEIEYKFIFSSNEILEEKLTVDRVTNFERIGNKAKLMSEKETFYYEVDASILFLRKLYFNTKFEGYDILKTWFEFLKQSVCINAYTRGIATYNGESLMYNKYFEKNGIDDTNDFLKKSGFKYQIKYTKQIKEKNVSYFMDEEEEKMVFFEREELGIPIPLMWESTGNKTLINILPAILHSVENGGMLIIDEFSSGFHNKLEELIVRYVMNKSRNTQMFLVSHSTNLLSNSLLRPDQIYSVEMIAGRGSVLNRFSDEQPRAAQNLEKMYLSGVFGGIPEYGINEE